MEIKKYKSVTSTNDVAKELARSGAAEWTVVLANEQTGGRGRKNRVWYSPPDVGLWFSVILRHRIPVIDAAKIGLVTALGVANTLRSELSLAAQIKWPNDVLIGQRKVSGILLESISSGGKLEALIVGIGINVNQTAFPEPIAQTATSLRLELNRIVPRDILLPRLLEELQRQFDRFRQGNFHHQMREWRRLCPMLGKPVTLHTTGGNITGTAVDVGDEGALIVRKPDGVHLRFFAGDVSISL
ncbi:MAG: biotin--[acetyl-CoA-carboxylase] ligase [Gemmatimonadetes bacterium]|nr:MAG: biotin--[acetyl-CoA-carboxylase] ligase [Gemmatimonadota bacterium]